jgi:2-iminoacetate synthase ThiH
MQSDVTLDTALDAALDAGQMPKQMPKQKIPLQKLYEDLANIGAMGMAEGAQCREQAQQVLANPKISLNWRDAIAERLHEANHTLGIKTVTGDDSY